MPKPNRRGFLKQSTAFAATFAIAGTRASGRILGANDTVRLAVAGLNSRGGDHVEGFAGLDKVQVTYLVDPDRRTWDRRLKTVEAKGKNTPQCVQDIRRALDDKEVDAISIATPNHWHALMTIWACQAGKDVYVEKPCCHEIHEGEVAAAVARKHGSIVQHGTQSRSERRWAQVAELTRSGRYGKLLVSRALCYKPRPSIGKKADEPSPAELDFDLWLGPAPTVAFNPNLVHYNWHWFWPYGNGDIGNQGVHQMDIARWMIPGAGAPASVVSLGGRFGYEDQAETPNTLVTVLSYGPEKPLIVFEVRGLPTDAYYGERSGNVLHFEEGVVAGHRFYPRGRDSGEPLPRVETTEPRPGGENHFANFIAAVRTRNAQDLNAPLDEGLPSTSLCHLPNISYRLGEPASIASSPQPFGDCAPGQEAFERMTQHLAGQGVSLGSTNFRMGRALRLEPGAFRFADDAEANALLTRSYRKGFELPELA